QVAPGETLAAIAKRYGASPASIATVNKLASAEAMPGDHLLIPAASRLETPQSTYRGAARAGQQRASTGSAAAARNSRAGTSPANKSAATGYRSHKQPVIVARSTPR